METTVPGGRETLQSRLGFLMLAAGCNGNGDTWIHTGNGHTHCFVIVSRCNGCIAAGGHGYWECDAVLAGCHSNLGFTCGATAVNGDGGVSFCCGSHREGDFDFEDDLNEFEDYE